MYLASPLARKAVFADAAERTMLLDTAGGTVPARAFELGRFASAPGGAAIQAEPLQAAAFLEVRGREVAAVDLLASALDRSLEDDTRRSTLKALAGLVGDPAVMETVRRAALNTFPSDPSWDPDGGARLAREVGDGGLADLFDAVRSSVQSVRRLQESVRAVLAGDRRAPWRALIERRLFEGWLYADALGGRGDVLARSDLVARIRSSLRTLPAEAAEDAALVDDLAAAFAGAVRAPPASIEPQPVLRNWAVVEAAPTREASRRVAGARDDVRRRLAFDVGFLFAAAAAQGGVERWEYLLDAGVAALPGEPLLWDAKIACRVHQGDNVGAWTVLKEAVERGLSAGGRRKAGYVADFARARHMDLLVLDKRFEEAAALVAGAERSDRCLGGYAHGETFFADRL